MPMEQSTKPLSARAIEVMRPGDKVKADTGENRGLRVIYGNADTKTFFYRYTSPLSKKLVQKKIGNFPTTSLAKARVELQKLKAQRKSGVCPATELKQEKQEQARIKSENQRKAGFTVSALIDLYLEQYIEDRKSDGRRIPGARKPKGQDEVRRTLFASQKTGLPLQQKQLTEQAWRMRKAGSMLDIEPWTPHDLRRTVRTGLSRLRCRNEIAEAILGHSRSGIEGTYDLHGYEIECREWLQIWADHLELLITVDR